MKTFLAQNQFLSHPSVISPRTERSVAVSKPPPVADAAAALISNSAVSTTTAGSAAASSLVCADAGAAVVSVSNPVANASVEARPPENWGRQAGLSDGEAAIVAPVAEGVSRLADERTSAATSEFMDATARRDEHSISAATDHIHEIFHYVRNLMKQPPRFLLDEAEFMAAVEEEPLFIRDGEHLRRWA